MLAGKDGEHNLVIGQNCRYGKGAAGKGFADGDHIRADALVVAGEHFACAADAGLYLIGNKKDIVLVAEVIAGLEVAVRRDIYAGLSLDGLYQHCAHLVAFFFQDLAEGVNIVVGDLDEARCERPVLGIAVRIRRHCDDGDGPSVEVAVAHDDEGLVLRDALYLVTPAACKLQCRLNGLSA